MGQTGSHDNTTNNVVDDLQIELIKHAKIFSEIGALSYDDFKKCLEELNELSRKCLDTNGKQLIFLIKKGTDTSMFWKATVRIACIKVDPSTRKIENYKFLNLKQFLCVFKTFQSHLESLLSSEENQRVRQQEKITASILLDHVSGITQSVPKSPTDSENSDDSDDHASECCICLERKIEVLLPCTHVFCSPCIEQWNINNKTCPVCNETLENTNESWVMPDIPGVEEISDEICSELMDLSKENK
ncbi:RING finger protein 141-like [Condylostylus longicornis]|uniref:RING finger protein 141-like n=1 Tax=Condylostylus longicornis TaxID=2530218 RepID=UPI00244DF18A|nr:RING finger protein 141-like [Condylostylus longicornis]